MDNKTDARDALKSQAVPGDYGTALAMIFQACYDIMMDKRKARGTSNIFEQGEMSLLHRVRQDKLARIVCRCAAASADIDDVDVLLYQIFPVG